MNSSIIKKKKKFKKEKEIETCKEPRSTELCCKDKHFQCDATS